MYVDVWIIAALFDCRSTATSASRSWIDCSLPALWLQAITTSRLGQIWEGEPGRLSTSLVLRRLLTTRVGIGIRLQLVRIGAPYPPAAWTSFAEGHARPPRGSCRALSLWRGRKTQCRKRQRPFFRTCSPPYFPGLVVARCSTLVPSRLGRENFISPVMYVVYCRPWREPRPILQHAMLGDGTTMRTNLLYFYIGLRIITDRDG